MAAANDRPGNRCIVGCRPNVRHRRPNTDNEAVILTRLEDVRPRSGLWVPRPSLESLELPRPRGNIIETKSNTLFINNVQLSHWAHNTTCDVAKRRTTVKVVWHEAASLRTCYLGKGSRMWSAMVPLDRALMNTYAITPCLLSSDSV